MEENKARPTGTSTAEILDLAEDIEDGVICLDILAHADREAYPEEEYRSALDYLIEKLRENLTDLRVNLTYRLVAEKKEKAQTQSNPESAN